MTNWKFVIPGVIVLLAIAGGAAFFLLQADPMADADPEVRQQYELFLQEKPVPESVINHPGYSEETRALAATVRDTVEDHYLPIAREWEGTGKINRSGGVWSAYEGDRDDIRATLRAMRRMTKQDDYAFQVMLLPGLANPDAHSADYTTGVLYAGQHIATEMIAASEEGDYSRVLKLFELGLRYSHDDNIMTLLELSTYLAIRNRLVDVVARVQRGMNPAQQQRADRAFRKALADERVLNESLTDIMRMEQFGMLQALSARGEAGSIPASATGIDLLEMTTRLTKLPGAKSSYSEADIQQMMSISIPAQIPLRNIQQDFLSRLRTLAE